MQVTIKVPDAWVETLTTAKLPAVDGELGGYLLGLLRSACLQTLLHQRKEVLTEKHKVDLENELESVVADLQLLLPFPEE